MEIGKNERRIYGCDGYQSEMAFIRRKIFVKAFLMEFIGDFRLVSIDIKRCQAAKILEPVQEKRFLCAMCILHTLEI